jgi:hypothetical protein
VDEQPFLNGTLTLYAEDGEDLDGDGLVDGDGDLADDSLDMLTLTAVGRYAGAVHRVRAVVAPPKRVLMVVDDPTNLTSEDGWRHVKMTEWGWTVRTVRAKARTDEFHEAARDVQVIYFPAHTKVEKKVKDYLKSTDLPVVCESKKLAKDLKIVGDCRDYDGSTIDVLERTVTTTDDLGVESAEVVPHYITSPFANWTMAICSAPVALLRYKKLLGAEGLAARPGHDDEFVLVALECGALQADKKPARARRVVMPWGHDKDFSFAAINASGLELLRRALDWAGSSWRGYLPGVAAWDKVEIKDMGKVDGYNSSLGDYGGANVNAGATVSSNAVGKDKIKVKGGELHGSAFVGPNADPRKALKIEDGGSLTGAASKLRLAVPVPTPRVPDDLGGSSGDLTISRGMTVLHGDLHVHELTLTGNARVRVIGSARIYSEDDIKIEQNAQLVLGRSAELTIHSGHKVEIKDNARVNMAGGSPDQLTWVMLKDKIELKDSAQLCAAVSTYDGELKVKEGAEFFGTFVGKKAKVENGAAWHVDTAISGSVVTIGAQTDLRRLGGKGVRWVERP